MGVGTPLVLVILELTSGMPLSMKKIEIIVKRLTI